VQAKSLFIIAGEPSGDLHGSHLIHALKTIDPQIKIAGIGGKKMAAEGLQSLFPFEQFQVMGFVDVLLAYSRLRKLFMGTLDAILQSKPDAVILIDYPGFNLRMAKHLKKRGYKGIIIQYISPTVWAWGKGRIQEMEHSLDQLLTIYPFEQRAFQNSTLNVNYVGNPLLETLQTHPYDPDWRRKCSLPEAAPLLALFPGSRPKEILRNLPIQMAAAKLLMKKNPSLHTVVSLQDPTLLPQEKNVSRLPPAFNYDCMQDCEGAIAKSGTVTLELALHGTPAVITYPLGTLNYLLAKYLFRINLPHYCISNILLNETLYPEWIDRTLSPEQIAKSLEEQMQKSTFPQKAIELKTILGNKVASLEAAQKIMESV
jgi:lipid-A-disaccharide synthase